MNISSFPTCNIALPEFVISAASGRLSISIESIRSCSLRHILNLELLSTLSSTTPVGFCVARIRCTPKLRPTLATEIKSFINSGSSFLSSANSSIIIKICGKGSISSFVKEMLLYWLILFTPVLINSFCLLSFSDLTDAIALIIILPERFDILPSTCGKLSKSFDIPPPL